MAFILDAAGNDSLLELPASGVQSRARPTIRILVPSQIQETSKGSSREDARASGAGGYLDERLEHGHLSKGHGEAEVDGLAGSRYACQKEWNALIPWSSLNK